MYIYIYIYVGVLCYMLLSGSPPFYGKSVEDVYSAILSKEVVYADKKFKHVSAACLDFMRRLLVRDPNSRMSIADALEHPFITGERFYSRIYNSGAMGSSGLGLTLNTGTSTSTNSTNSTNSSSGLYITTSSSADPAAAASTNSLSRASLVCVLDSMLFYAGAGSMVRVLAQLAAHTLGSGELYAYREEFQLLDRRARGFVSRDDFVHVLSASIASCGDAHAHVDLGCVFDNIARDRAAGITYHEYIAAAMHGRFVHRSVYKLMCIV
jgi:serine/threonine protein kinase